MSAVRVLHILPSISGYGAERLTVELLRHLPSTERRRRAADGLRAAGRQSADAPISDLSRVAQEVAKTGSFSSILVREIRRYAPDIVHTHTHVGKYWGRTAAIMAGVRRIVHTEHNPCDFRRTPGRTHRRLAARPRHLAGRHVLPRSRQAPERARALAAEQACRDSQRTRLCRSGRTTAAPPVRAWASPTVSSRSC